MLLSIEEAGGVVGLGLWGFVGSEFCGGLDCGS
jgi:hypothetical protein